MPSTAAQTATTGPKRTTTMALLVASAATNISVVWGPCDKHDDDEHDYNDHDDVDVDDDDYNDDDDKADTATAVGGNDNCGNSDGRGHRQQSTKISSEDTVAVATAIC
jgi:hypothetical protein